MRLFRFIVGVLVIGAAFFAFFRPDFVTWIVQHPILDAFVAALLVVFHYVNIYEPKGPRP